MNVEVVAVAPQPPRRAVWWGVTDQASENEAVVVGDVCLWPDPGRGPDSPWYSTDRERVKKCLIVFSFS